MNKLQKKLDYLQKAYNLPIDYAKKLIKPKFTIKKINVTTIMKTVKKIKTRPIYPAIHKPYIRNPELEQNFEEIDLLTAIMETDRKVEKYSKITAMLLSIILTGLFIFILNSINK